MNRRSRPRFLPRGLGLSIGWGLLAALDSLVSQAYGAGSQVPRGDQESSVGWDSWGEWVDRLFSILLAILQVSFLLGSPTTVTISTGSHGVPPGVLVPPCSNVAAQEPANSCVKNSHFSHCSLCQVIVLMATRITVVTRRAVATCDNHRSWSI